MDRQWAVQMDGRITDAWERGDERMPSENRVKKLVDDLVKRYREQLHEREFKVSPDGAAMAVLTHRSERDPDAIRERCGGIRDLALSVATVYSRPAL
jgi:hypothetical protein